jgi:hypothetical protein
VTYVTKRSKVGGNGLRDDDEVCYDASAEGSGDEGEVCELHDYDGRNYSTSVVRELDKEWIVNR